MNIDFKSWMGNLLGGFKSGGYTDFDHGRAHCQPILKGEHPVDSVPGPQKAELTVRELRELKVATEQKLGALISDELSGFVAATGVPIESFDIVLAGHSHLVMLVNFEIKLSDL